MNQPSTATWTTSSLAVPGARLHVKRTGAGGPLVLVHGTGTDCTTWDGVAPALAGEHEVVVYDRRGYGRSEHPPVRDYRTHVRDLAAVLASTGPAHVLGWSSGGNTALALAVVQPGLFRSLTVLEAPFHGTRLPTHGLPWAMATVKVNQARGRHEEAARVFLRWASGLVDGTNGFDRTPADVQAHLVGYARHILAELDPHPFGVMAEFVRTRRLSALQGLPVTWLLGQDTLAWYDVLRRRAVRAAPHIRTIRIPGAGHLAHHENPTAFTAALLDATRRTPVQRA